MLTMHFDTRTIRLAMAVLMLLAALEYIVTANPVLAAHVRLLADGCYPPVEHPRVA